MVRVCEEEGGTHGLGGCEDMKEAVVVVAAEQAIEAESEMGDE